MPTLYLCGAGNSEGVRLALRVNAAEGRWDRIVLLDDDHRKRGRSLLGIEVVGTFALLADADPAHDSVVNLVARTTAGRSGAGETIASYGVPFAGLVAPGIDTLGAAVAGDALIYPGAIIGPEAVVGEGSVIFMGAVVGHEARVGAGCVVAANAVLNARVDLGAGVYVGSNATVLPELAVGAGATIGAGSTVVGSVPDGATVLGVPAQVVVPGKDRPGRSTKQAPAHTAADIERSLSAAWAEALDIPNLEGNARIFDLGATSLAALQVAARVRSTAGLDVAVVDLFRFATIRELAHHLSARAAPAPTAIRSPPPPSGPTREGAGTLLADVVAVFGDLLEVPDAGPESHFFDLGGDPALAQRACDALERLTGEPLCFMQVARYPTPLELARHLEATRGQPPSCPAQGVMTRLIHRHEWQRG